MAEPSAAGRPVRPILDRPIRRAAPGSIAARAVYGAILFATRAGAAELPPVLDTEGVVAISHDCGALEPSLLGGSVVRTLCPMAIQGRIFDGEGLASDELLMGFGAQGGLVAVHDAATGQTLAYDGVSTRLGSANDTVFWGLWDQGTVTASGEPRWRASGGSAVPYIAGVSAHAVAASDRLQCHHLATPAAERPICAKRSRFLLDLPDTGSANYTLIGDAGVVSALDVRGGPVPVGSVRSAHAHVDFATGQVTVDLTVEVRGLQEPLALALGPRLPAGSLSGGAALLAQSCQQGAAPSRCPQAEARFYGRDGEYLGVTFSYVHSAVLPETQALAAHLSQVPASGALVLKHD